MKEFNILRYFHLFFFSFFIPLLFHSLMDFKIFHTFRFFFIFRIEIFIFDLADMINR